jgi:hypothetical protein
MVVVELFEMSTPERKSSLASSKETPWFFWLARFLARSQVTLTAPV